MCERCKIVSSKEDTLKMQRAYHLLRDVASSHPKTPELKAHQLLHNVGGCYSCPLALQSAHTPDQWQHLWAVDVNCSNLHCMLLHDILAASTHIANQPADLSIKPTHASNVLHRIMLPTSLHAAHERHAHGP
jgi:hypothetical protein